MLSGRASVFGLSFDYAVVLFTTAILVFIGARVYPVWQHKTHLDAVSAEQSAMSSRAQKFVMLTTSNHKLDPGGWMNW